jgi:hypothetical protein
MGLTRTASADFPSAGHTTVAESPDEICSPQIPPGVKLKHPVDGIRSTSFPGDCPVSILFSMPPALLKTHLQNMQFNRTIFPIDAACAAHLQTIGRSAYHPTLIGYSTFWSA